MTPSSNFDYSGGSTNNNGNNSSSRNDLSGKTDDHTEDQHLFFTVKKAHKAKYGSSPPEVLFKKVFCKYASNCQKNTHADL